MPPKQGGNKALDLLKKAGAAKAWNAHKADETVYDTGGDLPAGIEGGVAKLTEAKIGTVEKDGPNKGKPYFSLTGICVEVGPGEPAHAVGKRVSLFEPLYDTPGKKVATLDDHINACLNEMRKLGADTEGSTLDDWEAILDALVENETLFRFRTWKSTPTAQYPNPRVNTVFKGKVEDDYVQSTDDGGVDDSTGGEDSSGEADGTDSSGEVDWEAVGTAANEGDEEAQGQITEALRERGFNDDQINAYPTWGEAAEAVAQGAEPAEEASGEDEEWQPNKGDVVPYKPKGAKKPFECEIIAVMKETLDLRSLADKKTVFRKVPYTGSPKTLNGNPLE